LNSSSGDELSSGGEFLNEVLLDSQDHFLLSCSLLRLRHIDVGLQLAPGFLSGKTFLVNFSFEGVVFQELDGGLDGGVALVDGGFQLLFSLDQSVVLVGQVG